MWPDCAAWISEREEAQREKLIKESTKHLMSFFTAKPTMKILIYTFT